MTKLARRSFKEPYECKKDWDEDCGVQCGGEGVVVSKNSNYRTAFFEAFPKNPATFIRGEGKTIEEAEERAWEQLQKYKACTNHEFERRGYTNGIGFCKHCGLYKSKCFEPSETCKICGKHTFWTSDKNKNYYCKEHAHLMPYEDMNSYQQEDFNDKLKENLSTLDGLSNYTDREYYLEHNLAETKFMEEMMVDIFKELSLGMNFNDINTADIKEKYIFTVKNYPLAIDMFRRKHEYIDYKSYKKGEMELFALRFKEKIDVSFKDEDKNNYINSGREIYLFSIDNKSMITLINMYSKKNI